MNESTHQTLHWKDIHFSAVKLAKKFKEVQSSLLNVIQEIDSRKIFRSLGYNSLWEYCLKALNLSESDTEVLIRVARKSQEIPGLKQAVQKGQINLSAARKLCSVITEKNQTEWLSKAQELSQRDLEKEIVKVNPKAKILDKLKPLAEEITELHCAISSEVEALILKVQDLESKRQKKNISLEEAFRQMASLYLEKKDPVQKAKKSMAKISFALNLRSAAKASSVSGLRRIPQTYFSCSPTSR